jgi:hypothetical protein
MAREENLGSRVLPIDCLNQKRALSGMSQRLRPDFISRVPYNISKMSKILGKDKIG